MTGGDSGIGRAIVLHYAREGADVAISYLDEHQDAEETFRAVTQSGQQALLLPGDLRSADHCKYGLFGAGNAFVLSLIPCPLHMAVCCTPRLVCPPHSSQVIQASSRPILVKDSSVLLAGFSEPAQHVPGWLF